ncbi:MAG: hypothetical protein KC443_00230 [Anaerolineales bacterium]|nr:hypothetical protein [Anaerolineales bacterium]
MNNQQIINEGLNLLTQTGLNPAMGETAVTHYLHTTPYLTAALIAQRHDAADIDHANLVKLFEKINRHFDDSELRDLCFQLQVDYADLSGMEKRDKVRELVTWMDRHGRLPDLTTLANQLRPKVKWQDLPQHAGNVPIVAKLDVAVVVDIARPADRVYI